MQHHVPPLRWILPLAQLVLCAVILWPLLTMFVGQVRTSLGEYGILRDKAASPVIPRLRPFDLSDLDVQRRIKISETRERAVAALDLPGGLPDLAYAILSPAHSEWRPRGMLLWAWRDLSWPIIGIFFWWLAGRSVEALLFSRRKIVLPKIRWWEVVVSLPALIFGAILAVGLCIDQSSRTELPFWMPLVVFGTLWVALSSCTVAAFIVQWRLRRRLPSSSVEQPIQAATT